MNVNDSSVIGGLVLTTVQLLKFAGIPSKYAVWMVFALTAIALYIFKASNPTLMLTPMDYFMAFIGISTSAAGAYGFVKQAVEGVKKKDA